MPILTNADGDELDPRELDNLPEFYAQSASTSPRARVTRSADDVWQVAALTAEGITRGGLGRVEKTGPDYVPVEPAVGQSGRRRTAQSTLADALIVILE